MWLGVVGLVCCWGLSGEWSLFGLGWGFCWITVTLVVVTVDWGFFVFVCSLVVLFACYCMWGSVGVSVCVHVCLCVCGHMRVYVSACLSVIGGFVLGGFGFDVVYTSGVMLVAGRGE